MGDDPVNTCQMAMEKAINKSMDFCSTDEARIEGLSDLVGLHGDERNFDADELLENGPESADGVEGRQWVAARANELVVDGKSPHTAVNTAWRELPEEADSGGETPPEEDEAPDTEGVEAEPDTDEEVVDEADEEDAPTPDQDKGESGVDMEMLDGEA